MRIAFLISLCFLCSTAYAALQNTTINVPVEDITSSVLGKEPQIFYAQEADRLVAPAEDSPTVTEPVPVEDASPTTENNGSTIEYVDPEEIPASQELPVSSDAATTNPPTAAPATITPPLPATTTEQEQPYVETEDDIAHFTDTATLQGLNKITARASTLKTSLNKAVTFGNLEITLRKCWKAAPEELPENKALLEIWEQKPGEKKERIFYGWMFASSPGLSALEHPVYDIVVISCGS